jgi:alkylation response protein AidB-like acyl-CoA dehydrogenase
MMYRTAHLIDRLIKSGSPSDGDIGQLTAAALEEYLIECSIMKIYGSETQGFVADESVQIFGGYGYIYENPAELAFRNARINRIWEGTNEINRITVTNTLLKRSAKGRLDLNIDMPALSREIMGFQPVTSDSPETLETQEQMLSVAKYITRWLIGVTLERFEKGLRDQQELAGIICDVLIEIYAFESAYLRARQMDAKQKGRGRETALKIAKVLSARLYDKLGSLTCRALPALVDDKSLPEKLALARTLLCPPPIDTIIPNRQIAENCVQKKGYPFKVV